MARLAVVAEARDDAAERLGALVEVRPAGVVLEARERAAGPARSRAARRRSSAARPRPCAAAAGRCPAAPRRRGRGRSGRAAGSRRRRRGRPRLPATASRERRALRGEVAARRAPARGPGRRRRRRGRPRGRHGVAQTDRRARRARARAPRPAPSAPRCCRGRRRCSGDRDTDARRGSSRGALPVLRDVAALGDDPPQREHRGVGRQHDELAARRRQREPAVERVARATARPRSAREPGRRTRNGARVRPRASRLRPRARDRRGAARSRRPRSTRRRGHRRSRRSARRPRATAAPPSSSVRTASFAPAGFLISSISSRRSPIRDPLEAAERGGEALEPGGDLRQRHVERGRERRGRRSRCRRCRGPATPARREPTRPDAASVNALPSRPRSSISRAATSSGSRARPHAGQR